MTARVTFQDNLFNPHRVVERTLDSGTILQLTLEPLPGERVRVLQYRRKAKGERWVTVKAEAGRTVAWNQLGLKVSFEAIFGSHETNG